jgi:hypothetical protein
VFFRARYGMTIPLRLRADTAAPSARLAPPGVGLTSRVSMPPAVAARRASRLRLRPWLSLGPGVFPHAVATGRIPTGSLLSWSCPLPQGPASDTGSPGTGGRAPECDGRPPMGFLPLQRSPPVAERPGRGTNRGLAGVLQGPCAARSLRRIRQPPLPRQPTVQVDVDGGVSPASGVANAVRSGPPLRRPLSFCIPRRGFPVPAPFRLHRFSRP